MWMTWGRILQLYILPWLGCYEEMLWRTFSLVEDLREWRGLRLSFSSMSNTSEVRVVGRLTVVILIKSLCGPPRSSILNARKLGGCQSVESVDSTIPRVSFPHPFYCYLTRRSNWNICLSLWDRNIIPINWNSWIDYLKFKYSYLAFF